MIDNGAPGYWRDMLANSPHVKALSHCIECNEWVTSPCAYQLCPFRANSPARREGEAAPLPASPSHPVSAPFHEADNAR